MSNFLFLPLHLITRTVKKFPKKSLVSCFSKIFISHPKNFLTLPSKILYVPPLKNFNLSLLKFFYRYCLSLLSVASLFLRIFSLPYKSSTIPQVLLPFSLISTIFQCVNWTKEKKMVWSATNWKLQNDEQLRGKCTEEVNAV